MVLLAGLFSPVHGTGNTVAAIIGGLVVSLVLLVLAHMFLRRRERRWLIIVVTFLGGLFFAVEYFWPTHAEKGRQVNFLTAWIEPATLAIAVIGSFTVALGVYSLGQVHGRRLLRLQAGWLNSLAFFVSMILMFVLELWNFYAKPPASGALPLPNAFHEILFNGLYMPLQAATFSLLAFYIASAAYRAFRIRTGEAAVMMAAAFIVMLGQVPLGSLLTSWIPAHGSLAFLSFFRVEQFSDWIMRWWNAPAQRGITFGIAVGGLAMSLRIWLSLERGTFFSDQPEENRRSQTTEASAEP